VLLTVALLRSQVAPSNSMENHVHEPGPVSATLERPPPAQPTLVQQRAADSLRLDESLCRYSGTHSIALRDQIVADATWMAMRGARHFSHRGEPFDDLLQVARIGLLNAVERFDPSHGVAFGAYATPTIMGELRRHFRDRTWTVYVPRRAKDMRNAVGSATDDLRADLHRTPRAAEIADRLAITTGLVNEVQQANNARYATTLDRADGRRDESGDGFDAMLDRTVLAALLAHLAPRERRVLELRFFEELSQAEIAQRIGTSQVHVGRLIVASLAALRVLADEQHDDRRAA